jgi:thiol-disulfide isomerase/thioredoxin
MTQCFKSSCLAAFVAGGVLGLVMWANGLAATGVNPGTNGPATVAERREALGEPCSWAPLAECGVEVLAFTSTSCAACRADYQALDHLQSQGMRVRRIDVQRHPAVTSHYRVRHLPTYVITHNGREVARTGDPATIGVVLMGILLWLFCT